MSLTDKNHISQFKVYSFTEHPNFTNHLECYAGKKGVEKGIFSFLNYKFNIVKTKTIIFEKAFSFKRNQKKSLGIFLWYSYLILDDTLSKYLNNIF